MSFDNIYYLIALWITDSQVKSTSYISLNPIELIQYSVQIKQIEKE